MSDYEAHKGRVVPIKRLDGELDFEYFKRVTGVLLNEDELEDDLSNALYDYDLYEKFFYVNETLYKNVDHEELDPYSSRQELKGNDIDGYEYFMMFYNGGCSLSELIEESLTKLNKK